MLDLQGYAPIVIAGLKNTLAVGILAMSIALLLGLLGAWGKISSFAWVRGLANAYTTVMRGVPELILLLLVYYGVPSMIQNIASSAGYELILDINPFVAGTATLALIYGAFCTEVFRGAFAAIDTGQAQSAKALGMHRALIFQRILLPQALSYALPGLGNTWLVLIKATALISIIQLNDVMGMAKVTANATREPFTAYFLASLLFLGITILSMAAQHLLEKRYSQGGVN